MRCRHRRLNGGTTSVTGAANSLVSQIGVITQQAQNNATAQQTVNQNATTALNNLSGVNLDQEAATHAAVSSRPTRPWRR